jgi:hypothetical protein
MVFDAIFLVMVLWLSGTATPVLCRVPAYLDSQLRCNDSRGLLIVTLLAPLIYAYIVFNSEPANDSSVYLRVLFPLVISLFYGYFAQVDA